MPAEEILLFATNEELDDTFGVMQMTAFPLYVPENEVGISEGEYSRNEFVRLLRDCRSNPNAIYFLADMLEG